MSAKILVVENNGTFLNQITKLLEDDEYEVQGALTALEAFKITIRNPVDLIVANLQLPSVSGLHLAKKLRSRPLTDHIPMLLIGKKSLFSEKIRQRIEAMGIHYLYLPLNRKRLLEEVEVLFREKPVPSVIQPSEDDPLGDLEETNNDSSQLDTDKFNVQKLGSRFPKPVPVMKVLSAEQTSDTDADNEMREASRVLAEITQQAEDNLSTILPRDDGIEVYDSVQSSNYLSWWGFKLRPFSNTPDSRFYFSSKQHSEAISRLMYAVENMEGLAVLIGKIGAGKTTLARRMLESFNPEEYVVALMVIIHSAITPDWLLRRIAMQLGVKDTKPQKLLLIGQLYNRLVEIYESGKKAVILIDEAQMLQTRDLMEEFRGLLNLEVPGKKLLTFVFFGLEELNQYLALDEPLKQRIALKYTLHSFDRPATRSYILHRMKIAGINNPIFSDDAVNLVFELSGGTPRLINTICNNALLEGFFLKKRYIDQNLVRLVGESLDLKVE